MFFSNIIFIGIIIFFIVSLTKSKAVQITQRNGRVKYRTLASDSHYIPKKKDITCKRYGHKHPIESIPRYIVHEEPETGYVILNGIKRKISDCKYL